MSAPLTDQERAFLSALAGIHRSWSVAAGDVLEAPAAPAWVEDAEGVAILRQALTAPEAREAMRALMSQVIGGVLHSVLATLDGDSNAPDTENLSVSASNGAPFRRFLHEYLYEFVPLSGDEG
jgi:hypothetical protein